MHLAILIFVCRTVATEAPPPPLLEGLAPDAAALVEDGEESEEKLSGIPHERAFGETMRSGRFWGATVLVGAVVPIASAQILYSALYVGAIPLMITGLVSFVLVAMAMTTASVWPFAIVGGLLTAGLALLPFVIHGLVMAALDTLVITTTFDTTTSGWTLFFSLLPLGVVSVPVLVGLAFAYAMGGGLALGLNSGAAGTPLALDPTYFAPLVMYIVQLSPLPVAIASAVGICVGHVLVPIGVTLGIAVMENENAREE